MDISIIVFAGIVVCGISTLPLVFRSARKLFKEYVHYKNKQEQKKQEQKIEEKKDELKETVNNGNLSDLINAADKLGKENNKKH